MKHQIKNNIQQQESQPVLHYIRSDKASKLFSNSKQWLCTVAAQNGIKISVILNYSSASATWPRRALIYYEVRNCT
jgi:hypothetical protein